ncbi:MAG: serine/threonine protein kinase [Myxococcales bacterium]|nr:serine/threonine protein kinase [Myxococcales bacterium]
MLSALATGAFGAVYRGRSLATDRPVAIKFSLVAEGSARLRFEREAQLLSRIVHPNVVRLLDFGGATSDAPGSSRDADELYAVLVMELVDGVTLSQLLAARGGTLPWPDAAKIVLATLEGLDAAHDAGVLHRDVKPQNILIEPNGDVPKLVDFGIARATDDDFARVTEDGAMLGSLAYMSPEQLAIEPVDARTDVYAAGIVLYELLSGTLPFEGAGMKIAVDKLDSAGPIAMKRPASGARWPDTLTDLVLAMLRRDPAERPASAALVVEELRTLLARGK